MYSSSVRFIAKLKFALIRNVQEYPDTYPAERARRLGIGTLIGKYFLTN